MFCKNCGAKLDGDEKFCSKCGKSVKIAKKQGVKREESVYGFRFTNLVNGRLSRRNYFSLWFLNLILILVLVIIGSASEGMGFFSATGMIVWGISMCIIGPTVLIRRLHDIGISGWYLLLIFVPLLGSIAALYFAFGSPRDEDNPYGEYNDRTVNFGKIFGFEYSN